jgi:hypothetical protein
MSWRFERDVEVNGAAISESCHEKIPDGQSQKDPLRPPIKHPRNSKTYLDEDMSQQ